MKKVEREDEKEENEITPHDKEGGCECFWCRNRDMQEVIEAILERVNKENHATRVTAVKRLVKVLLAFTHLSLVDRVGILGVLEHEFISTTKLGAGIKALMEEQKKKGSAYIA